MIGLSRLKRAIADVPTGGMQTGTSKVPLKLCDAQRLEVEFNAIIAERDAALAQNAELVAKIDAIKDAWMAAGSWPNTVEEKQAIANAINATPTQCLRDIQAEAGRAGFLEGVRQMAENEIGWFGNDADSCANHYALRVKDGYE